MAATPVNNVFGPAAGNETILRANATATYVQGTGILPQTIFGSAIVIVLWLVFVGFQNVYTYYLNITQGRTELVANTISLDKMQTISVNPNTAGSTPLALSSNERAGVEFSYAFYLNVDPTSFRQEEGLLAVFHKGYGNAFPLMCPGVFLKSEKNTLRVYVGTYKTWNVYADCDGFPVGMWAHVCVVIRNTHAEVYVNGNLARKLPFDGFQAYQNYGDIQIACQRQIRVSHTKAPSTDEGGFNVFGAARGMLSRLNYFRYALSYSEIQGLVNEGPSSQMEVAGQVVPPYLAPQWYEGGGAA